MPFLLDKKRTILSSTVVLLDKFDYFWSLIRGYIPGKTLFYYRTRNDKEIDFVTRKGSKVERLIQVCYDISSEKTRKRELDSLVEAAEELHCNNFLVITNSSKEKIEWKKCQISIIPVFQISNSKYFEDNVFNSEQARLP